VSGRQEEGPQRWGLFRTG
jgi:hypothetical protein